MRLLIALVLVLGLPAAAYAQSCNALRAQLASAQAGGGGGGANMAKLRRQAQAFGCNSNARFGQHRSCAGILAQLSRGGGGVDRGKVRRLQRQIARRCDDRTRQARRPAVRDGQRGVLPPQPLNRRTSNERIIFGTRPDNHLDGRSNRGGIFGGIFGNRTRTVRIDRRRPQGDLESVTIDENEIRRRASTGQYSGSLATRGRRSGSRLRVGSARTVCVRLCDGFYFPINARSHSDNFYDENAMCVGRCPGADVSLYVHSASAPVETMRSTLTGEAYVKLPTAFDYRKEKKAGCGCQPASMIAEPLDADKTLQLVGIGSELPKAAELGTKVKSSSWVRYRAVYNGTGQPLPVFATDGRSAAEVNVVKVEPLRPKRREEYLGKEDTVPLTEFVGIRAVGPVFLPSLDEDAEAVETPEPLLTAAPVAEPEPAQLFRRTSGAVSIVPLPDSVVPAATTNTEFNDASVGDGSASSAIPQEG